MLSLFGKLTNCQMNLSHSVKDVFICGNEAWINGMVSIDEIFGKKVEKLRSKYSPNHEVPTCWSSTRWWMNLIHFYQVVHQWTYSERKKNNVHNLKPNCENWWLDFIGALIMLWLILIIMFHDFGYFPETHDIQIHSMYSKLLCWRQIMWVLWFLFMLLCFHSLFMVGGRKLTKFLDKTVQINK